MGAVSASRRRRPVASAVLISALAVLEQRALPSAQSPSLPAPAAHSLTIPFLANDSKPNDLDFTAASCDVAADGGTMNCRFRQVFLTVADNDITTCVMTTNEYDQIFRRSAPARWTTTTTVDDRCGRAETTTLEDGGTVRWTMTIERFTVAHPEQRACPAAANETEVYSWQHINRKLPCTSFQPGAIER